MNKYLKFIIFLSFLGILISSYATYHHYSTSVGICNIDNKLSCDIVNRSVYSEIFGIPVALIGIIGYVLIILVSLLLLKENTKDMKRLLLALTSFGFLFSLYLTYIEAFKLQTYCPLCVLSAIFMLIIFLSGLRIFYKR